MLPPSAELLPTSTPGLLKLNPTGNAPVAVLNAKPVLKLQIPEKCQPPMTSSAHLGTFRPMYPVRPNGRSYTQSLTKTCLASKSELPRQTLRSRRSQIKPPATVFTTVDELSME